MVKLQAVQEQGLRVMAVRSVIESSGQATRKQQEFLLSFRQEDDAYIEDLLSWLVVDAGVKLGQIICAIKCCGGQPGRPRPLALQLARRRVAVVTG